MKIFLVRHGRTLFNQKKVWQGWCDAPLLQKEGVELSRALGLGLKEIPFEAVYSSPLKRARDTAKYFMEGYGKEYPVQILDDLIEMNFGTLEGDPISEELHERFYEGYERFGGDSVESLTGRMIRALETIRTQNPQGNVLAVSHGWAIRCALRHIDQKRLDDLYSRGFHSANCSVSILEYADGKWTIQSVYDKSYTEKGLNLLKEDSE